MNAPRKTLLIAMAALFVTAAVGTALAQSEEGSARRTAAEERRAELQAARTAALDGFHANRTAALDAYHAAINATRTAFLAAKADVLADCAEQRNATEGNETAKCVKDGLKPLIEQARADHKAAREALKASLLDARRDAISGFAAAKARVEARAEARAAAQEG